jgi:pilus assembly protein FimV
VFVNIASPRDFERVGLDRSHFLTQLSFEVTTAPDGSLVVNVTSREALREPYLNFLVEVTWPQGRLMREYAVLVDPPMYAEDSGLQEEVTAPSATATASSPRTQASSTSQRTDRARSATRSAADQFGPTGPSDTLWSIAERVRPDNSLSIQQVMLALQDLNPDAFIGGNINRLKRGQVLRVPTTEQVRARTRAEANRLVNAQNRALQETTRPVDATGTADSGQAAGQPAATGEELKLVVDDGSGAEGAAAGDGELPGGVDAGEALAMEELEATKRENEELNSRLQDMQDQVETLQRLLELKNTQLAEMQQMDGEGDATAQAPGEQPGVTGTEQAATGEPEAAEAAEEDAQAAAPDGSESAGEAADGEEAMAESGETAVDGDMTEEQAAAEESMTAEEPGEEAAEVAAPAQQPTQPEQAEQSAPQPEPEVAQEPRKAFPGNVVDMIVNNPMYQIALGAGLLLLLALLLLVARKNANREKAFYDQLNSEAEGSDSDAIDLDVGEEEMPDLEGGDPLAEADAYIAYGRHDQAAHALETAISREPSRTDLRLKLLGIYADLKDRESFDKQFNEIEALEDDGATAEAESLRGRLEEAEATPSIDELESQLRSGDFSSDTGVTDQTLADQAGEDKPEDQPETADEFDGDFGSLGLDDATTPDESGDQPEQWKEDLSEDSDSGKTEESVAEGSDESADADSDHDMIEYDLSSLDEEKAEEGEETGSDEFGLEDALPEDASSEEEFEFDIGEDALGESDLSDTGLEEGSLEETSLEEDSDLDFGLEEEQSGADTDYSGFEESLEQSGDGSESRDEDDLSLDLSEDDLDSGLDLEPEDEAAAPEPLPGEERAEAESDDLSAEATEESTTEEADLDDLDESFLDELDAELDKVATEDESAGEQEDSLDDLELDVSDEDIALMEEFADSEAEEEPGSAIDEELGLEDAFTGEEEASPEEATAAEETLEEEPPAAEEQPEEELPSLDTPAEDGSDAGKASGEAGKSALDLDESELGDDDDFDFLSGTDEAATKLDLARAYMEMGDVDGARDILEEVSLEGNDEQKAEAQDLLKNLS